MSQPQVFTLTPANVSLTGFASNVTGATWTLTATSSGDNLAHSVTIRNDSITDHSAKTAVLTGTDPDGNAQTETLNLPGVSATVTSTKYFKTLTSVVPSATIGADTMDIGWGNKFSALTYVLNWRNSNAARIHVDVTGTINYSVQQASGNPGTMTAPSQSLNWQAITAFDAKTAGVLGAAAIGVTAIRAIANSYTDGATLIMYVNHPWDVVRA
jgi:hypothetical protein